jgi:hypothetical protein
VYTTKLSISGVIHGVKLLTARVIHGVELLTARVIHGTISPFLKVVQFTYYRVNHVEMSWTSRFVVPYCGHTEAPARTGSTVGLVSRVFTEALQQEMRLFSHLKTEVSLRVAHVSRPPARGAC